MNKKIFSIAAGIFLILTIFPATGIVTSYDSSDNIIPTMLNDAIIPRDFLNYQNLLSYNPDPGFYETSEYMIGTVAVGVILPESTGGSSTEDWTTNEQNQVTSEITAALNWWKGQNTNAGINFLYDWNYAISTVHEPINGPSVFTDPTWEATWVKDVMSSMGYNSGTEFDRVRNYINNLRTTKGTDWAFAVFVVDSSADLDGCFSDANPPASFYPCAWGYIGGPWVVMTYDNNGWGISAMDQVMAHETGHIFYAQDEYDGPTSQSGYFGAYESEYSGCLMHNNFLCLSVGTKLQIGWRDTDTDTIEDIIDTYPSTSINAYLPDPTSQTTLTYSGSSTVVPYTNNNPYGTSNDVTINTIAKVEYRINSGSWTGAQASDGLFDEPIEDYTMNVGPLSPGTYTIETRAMNSVSNYDLSPASDIVTISTNSAPNTPSNPNPSNHATGVDINVDLSWTGGDPDVGDTVTYDVYFGTSTPPTNVVTGQSGTTYDPGTMTSSTKYYWQIVSWDNNGASSSGSIWDFTTGSTNSPPNTPSIPSGPTSVNTGIQYTYSTSTTDPENDNVKYGWEWNGDSIVDSWSVFYPSGSTCNIQLTFTGSGIVNLRVKSEDMNGAQSAFSSPLTITVSGSNSNPNTPDTPTGPTTGSTSSSYDYSTTTTDPDNDNVKYGWDWDGDGIVDEWTTFQTSGSSISTSHSWSSTGTYNVRVMAEDINGAQSAFSTELIVVISGGSNNPPNKPNIPTGPSTGNAGTEYTYSTSTTDPDNDNIYYKWDWGDDIGDWDGPYDSGETISMGHIWDEKGDYSIKVKSKDEFGEESDWSDPLAISMPKIKSFNYFNLLIFRLFQRFQILKHIL